MRRPQTMCTNGEQDFQGRDDGRQAREPLRRKVERLASDPLCVVGEKAKWFTCYEKKNGTDVHQKIKLPEDLVTLLLGLYPEELKEITTLLCLS